MAYCASCLLIVVNDPGRAAFFMDATKVKKVDHFIYLGASYNNTMNIDIILRQYFSAALQDVNNRESPMLPFSGKYWYFTWSYAVKCLHTRSLDPVFRARRLT
eukprot:3682201-Amphidinium_carterae.2